MIFYTYRMVDLSKYVQHLRKLGHKCKSIDLDSEGYKLLVGFKSGVVDYLTEAEAHQLDGKTPMPLWQT